MKQMDFLKIISDLFAFKTIYDTIGNEYVVYKSSPIQTIDCIEDRTAFEAVENHVHLIEKVKPNDFSFCAAIGTNFGKALLSSLESAYPKKSFVVFVSYQIGESMIIRFHQKWENEPYYFDVLEWDTAESTLLKFESL